MKIAYIDAQNIHMGIKGLGWTIDWKKFFLYLKNKYEIDQIIMFFGYIPKYQKLYDFLLKVGYKIVFKEVSIRIDGSTKGNVDIDVAIKAMNDVTDEYLHEAYLVTTDSDFNSLIYEFRRRKIRGKLIVTHFLHTSKYLRKASGKAIQPLTDIRHLIQFENQKETDN